MSSLTIDPTEASKKLLMRKLTFLVILAWFSTHLWAADKIKYIILMENGIQAGFQTIEKKHPNTVITSFDFKENGRGPTYQEIYQLDEMGGFKSFQIKGTSEMGSKVEERFEIKKGLATWKSNAESGTKPFTKGQVYIPMDSSWGLNALLIQALNKRKSATLPLLPSGKLKMERIAQTTLKKGRQRRSIELLMQTGLGLSPQFFWATRGVNGRLFAVILPGYSLMVEEGWQEYLTELNQRQNDAEKKILKLRAQTLQKNIEGIVLIKNARIFRSESASVSEPCNIYFNKDYILGIYPKDQLPLQAGFEIDAKDRLVLPGLFDMHTHINRWSALYSMSAGVTSVRDMGNSNRELQEMISEVNAGEIIAPRIIPAGFIEGKSDYSSYDGILIETLDQAKRAIDWYKSNGYRHIKIYNSFPKEMVQETASYAHGLGLTVGGHVPAFMTALEAVEMGFNEINHINQVLLTFLVTSETDTRTLDRFYLPALKIAEMDFESKEVKDFIELLVKNKVVIDPTLTAFEFIQQQDGEMSKAYASIASHMPPDVERSFKVGSMLIPDEATAEVYKKSYLKMIEFTGILFRSGVPIVAGTDALPGFSLHSELALYVQAGLTPSEALKVASFDAAKIAGVERELGEIKAGKLADMIIVDGDPSLNIEDIRKVDLVITKGKYIFPNQLNEHIGVKPFVNQPSIVKKLPYQGLNNF